MANKYPKQCADCARALEMGFVPDVSMVTAQQSSWHRGEPEKKPVLGFHKSERSVKYDTSQLITIQALRCTGCGLLKFYANSPATD